MKNKITVSIAGQEYTMVAEEAESYVKRCAELVDAQVRGVMNGGHLGRSDAAVLAAGHCGFGLGATPTAIANMQAITERFGPSHMAFLVVPMVGAFFIDIVNALVIKLYLMLPMFA